MNMTQATFLADFEEVCDGLVEEAHELVRKSEEVMGRGERQAYSEITRAADRILCKEGNLSRDQAVARVLRQRPELYDAYATEHRLRLHMAEVSDRHHRAKVNKAWGERDALLDSYARTADEQAAFDAARKS